MYVQQIENIFQNTLKWITIRCDYIEHYFQKKQLFAESCTLEMPCIHVIEHNSLNGLESNLGKLVAKSILHSTKC